jgi:hypothetical protein
MAQRPNSLLAQLLAASAGLVSSAAVPAEPVAADRSVSYRHGDYDEDALAQAPVDGSDRRYRVRTEQFRLLTPAGEGASLSVDLTHEVMSGSSPWFSVPDANGQPLQVMSGASIQDRRSEVGVGYQRALADDREITVSASYSAEDDYHATAVGLEWSRPLSAAIEFGLGASFSHDRIDPTDAAEFGRIAQATKNTWSASAGLSFILDRSSLLQAGLQLTRSSGFLSDPYKRFFAGDRVLNEARPDQRLQGSLLLRYRRALVERDAALHLDGRYSIDNWGVHSYTVEAHWYQTLAQDWRVIPGFRYYTQSDSSFYAPFASVGELGRYYSSDYRLATGGGVSASLDLRRQFGAWDWVIGLERHRATDALGFGSGNDPGRVSYTQIQVGFDLRFD